MLLLGVGGRTCGTPVIPINPTFKSATRSYNWNSQDSAQTWDNNGNPTTYFGTSLTFDPENRMTAVGTAMTAGYRADGLRTWKTTSAGTTYFLYDGEVLLLETNGSGSVTAVNTWGPDGLLSRRSGGSSVFYVFDPQGSVAQRLDSGGAVLTHHVWDAWGSGSSSAATSDPYGFCGQWGYYKDWETGLHLLTHRYYDAGTGRFLARDPVGYAGGTNIYAYVANQPLGAVDPAGLWPLPNDPSGLPPGWQRDPNHNDPTNPGAGRWYPPGTDIGKGPGLEFHPGRPGPKGWEGKNHWHPVIWDPTKKEPVKDKRHLAPGDEAPLCLQDLPLVEDFTPYLIFIPVPKWFPKTLPVPRWFPRGWPIPKPGLRFTR